LAAQELLRGITLQHVFESCDLALCELGAKERDIERIHGAIFDGFVPYWIGCYDVGVAEAIQAFSATFILVRASGG
jgi:hypothetical protein